MTPRYIPAAVKQVLEANYRKDRYPTREQFEKMSCELGEKYHRLYEWYQQRRKKERKTLDIEQMESHPLAGHTNRRFSAVVKTALEAKYNNNRFPTRDELEQMSQELGESYSRLYAWFDKRRRKERRMVRVAGMESHPLLENLRPRISTAAIAALETKYTKNHYPSYEDIEKMSQELGESVDRVSAWYWRRRFKARQLLKTARMEEQPGKLPVSPQRLKLNLPRLEAAFQQDLYPTVEKIKLLAEELVVPWLSIAKWFQYRRRNERVLREKAGLETAEFRRIGLTHAKAIHLQEFLDRTQNLHPSQSEVHELATRAEVPVRAVRQWFTHRRKQKHGKPARGRRLSREQVALLQDHFERCRDPTKSAIRDIAREAGIRSVRVRYWFDNRKARERKPPTETALGHAFPEI